MRKTVLILVAIFIYSAVAGQIPNGFKYQAIIRDAVGNVNANISAQMDVSILQGTADGSDVFTETHQVTSNAFGLVNLTIGSQNPNGFELIDWANGPYFIKIKIDGVEFGTSQLLSVPYALHAKSATKATLAETVESIQETDPLFVASPMANITQAQIEEWTNKLSEYAETDPDFNASVAATISQTDLENWNGKLSEFIESDPDFAASLAKGITATDTAYWNSKLDEFVETDPTFLSHPVSGITEQDITMWKALWIWYTTNARGYLTSEVDGSITNEIQSISRTGLNVSLTDGGTFIDSVNTQDLAGVASINNSVNTQIKNLSNPSDAQDAVTKAYVDDLIVQLSIDMGFGVRDLDGNKYGAVKIGTQIWMSKNLKTTKYNDGTSIPLVTGNTAWKNLTTPAYCWYDNNEAAYGYPYGALYNWYAVETGKLCPSGWHVPSDSEWNTLLTYLGGTSIAGGKIKETGTSHWNSPNTGATNETNFHALPAGVRKEYGFADNGKYGDFWTRTPAGSTTTDSFAYNYYVEHSTARLMRNYGFSKNFGVPVRCIKD